MDVKRLPLYFIAFVYYNLSVETIAGKTKSPGRQVCFFYRTVGSARGSPPSSFQVRWLQISEREITLSYILLPLCALLNYLGFAS